MNNISKTKKHISNKPKLKVFVGMSGGVDSSVSAALLKQEGYEVTGVFIKVWQPDFMPCSWKEERREAMRVCAHLNIPFITLDLEREYKKEVVDYMIDEYKKGRTPNPDVMCNKYVKFGGFFQYALKHGADFVATGHYAHIKKRLKPTKYELIKGKDNNKDQTYFLWTFTEKQLAQTLFPVGLMEKSEVRALAKIFKLPNAEKKDSQGLCFVGKIDMKEFLAHYIVQKAGEVLNEKGQVIGTHQGALFYTLGERHGFEVTHKGPNEEAFFVISKNIHKNTITVSNKKFQQAESDTSLKLKDVNWISEIPQKNKIYQAKIRYRGTLREVKVVASGKTSPAFDIHFINDAEMAAPGQSVVIYDGDVCMGGGIIQ